MSEALRAGREPHCLGGSMILEGAMAESLTIMSRSRIFDRVLRSTIIRKDAGKSYETVPGVSKPTPFTLFH